MPVTSGELLFSMLYNFFCFSVFCVCYTLVLYVYLRSPVSQSTLEKGVSNDYIRPRPAAFVGSDRTSRCCSFLQTGAPVFRVPIHTPVYLRGFDTSDVYASLRSCFILQSSLHGFLLPSGLGRESQEGQKLLRI